jgi:hypothetical protein
MALAAGCRRPEPPSDRQEPPAGVAPPPAATPAPVDQLAPGELLEGSERAFGVALPRIMRVKGSFVDVVYGAAPTSVHALAQYFRSRVEEGSFREGPSAATFEHVKVRGKPGLELYLRILTAPDGTSVEIRDATPRAAPLLPDEASRWRQVGLTPNGRLIDPTHLD